ncbi:hypothetical protein MTP99_000476 [Tenebrio molitor]|jgi:hypothetical protein|nr:hypothetical protein MTP99_000476 [Tenebrio molitor]
MNNATHAEIRQHDGQKQKQKRADASHRSAAKHGASVEGAAENTAVHAGRQLQGRAGSGRWLFTARVGGGASGEPRQPFKTTGVGGAISETSRETLRLA